MAGTSHGDTSPMGRTLLVTANVGSVFEDPTTMLKSWTEAFFKQADITLAPILLQAVSSEKPVFIALHLQEVGGKNYETSMEFLPQFIESLLNSTQFEDFDRAFVLLDEDYNCAESFTALGNAYFIHKDVETAEMWDFSDKKYMKVVGREIHGGNIEDLPLKEKAKFPLDFFPECPSIYCLNRRRALMHTLQRFEVDDLPKIPLFLFGDFNFRPDTQGAIDKLTDGLQKFVEEVEDDEVWRFGDAQSLKLVVGKKDFVLENHDEFFQNDNGSWLREFEYELESFEGNLHEMPIQFPPTYPYLEQLEAPSSFMQTRCPAWCDRILMSQSAQRHFIDGDSDSVQYNMVGRGLYTGDHKPVYLSFLLQQVEAVPGTEHTTSELVGSPCLPADHQICVIADVWERPQYIPQDSVISDTGAEDTAPECPISVTYYDMTHPDVGHVILRETTV
ncbi:unnamed protein product [Darwinula stevensoni]|uniref:inositol-polyphosphate 5-phosphatase n=1 Tax=Darwinula stevensoni TaxID=69355 RepID=A0A7R8X582_9CRUS|nr:unnamed protein product [Darwinula stevensoni]CAG0878497.1 unnamed protein product [Darwinula stevensoni]